jgi:hypothetical protein
MARLVMQQLVKELGLVPQGSRERAQTSDVLRMSPAGIVPTAVWVRDEGNSNWWSVHRFSARVGDGGS